MQDNSWKKAYGIDEYEKYINSYCKNVNLIQTGFRNYNFYEQFNNLIPKQPDYSKYNCVFRIDNGTNVTLLINAGKTVEDLILTFFKTINREDLLQEKIFLFLYNANELDYHSKIKVEKLFEKNLNPTIIALEVDDLIGA